MTTEPDNDAPNISPSDLTFLKGLASEGPKVQVTAGQVFMCAGVLYGLQCLLNWVPLAFHLSWPPLAWLLVGFGPTALFLAVVIYIVWRERGNQPQGIGARALNAAYSSAGIANLFVVGIFAYNGIEQKSMTLWLLYPAVICVFQGAVWYVAYMIRRKLWLIGVSVGWFATSIALGLMIHDVPNYLLVLGLALLILMGGGGAYMAQQAKKGG